MQGFYSSLEVSLLSREDVEAVLSKEEVVRGAFGEASQVLGAPVVPTAVRETWPCRTLLSLK